MQHPRELRPAAMGHNSADYIHTLIEAMKLSYADRDTYYGDPAIRAYPGEGLLSKAYAKERAAMIDPSMPRSRSSPAIHCRSTRTVKRVAVLDGQNASAEQTPSLTPMPRCWRSAGIPKDTTHMSVIDKDGNMFDTTSSGGWISGAVILGDTGIGMSIRGEQFWLDETHADHCGRARARATR